LGVGLFAALLASYLWGTLALVGLLYLVSIPFSLRRYMKEKAELAETAE